MVLFFRPYLFCKGRENLQNLRFCGIHVKHLSSDECGLSGTADSAYKIRTKKKVIRAIVDKMEELAENRLDYSGKCYISQSNCYEDARAVADLVEERFPKLNGKVLINDIGTTIGSHTGPGTVALFFWGDERKD